MLKIDTKGFKEFQNDLKELADNIQNLEGTYDLDEIFSSKFMNKHTGFNSIYEFFEANQIPTDKENFELFPEVELDKIIQDRTSFKSWEEMQESAADQFFISKLGW